MEGCLSTHGGAGYAPGTYVNSDGEIICGTCRQVIGNTNDGKSRVDIPNWVGKQKES